VLEGRNAHRGKPDLKNTFVERSRETSFMGRERLPYWREKRGSIKKHIRGGLKGC